MSSVMSSRIGLWAATSSGVLNRGARQVSTPLARRVRSSGSSSHFLISEENELALFWYLSGEFVDQTRAGFRVVKSGVG